MSLFDKIIIFLFFSVDDIDQSILDEVVRAGFDRDQAIQAILDRSYDDAAAIYFLLMDRKEKNSLQRFHSFSFLSFLTIQKLFQ